ncbi:MAG: hypothetical protein WCI51_08230 [Lentisphaerota bacterium]
MPDVQPLDYIFSRQNPFYTSQCSIWLRSLSAYSGGSKYIQQALIKHISEIEPEFAERKNRAYYFNYPRKIAKLITQYVLSQAPTREGSDSDLVADFDRSGLNTNEVMRQFSTILNVFGVAWLCVDMPNFEGELTKEQEQIQRIRPYCYALSPLSVVDWCYGSDGKLQWVLTKAESVDNSDPMIQPVTVAVRCLWTRTDMTVFQRAGNAGAVAISKTIEHGLGVVPFVRVEEVDGYGINAQHWFEDVVRISDAILNNESEAQMNTVKQMFGLLVISEAFARSGNKPKSSEEGAQGESLSHVIARSAAIWETNEEKGITRYVSPSGVETTTIRSENQNLRRELFDVIGLAIQKDSKAIETAEAKAWDHQHVEQFLQTRADILEQAEKQAWQIMTLWKNTVAVPDVVYNRNFAVLDLSDAIASLLEISSLSVESPEFQREVNRTGITLLNRIRQIPQDRQDTINQEIDASTPATLPVATGGVTGGGNVDNNTQIV